MRNAIGYATGLLFGLGLVVSGMANPAKVLNFLDLFGTWDPSLAFVMGGAVLVAFVGYRLTWTRQVPLLGSRFELPTRQDLDPRLLAGAAMFGLGWGLGGFCPGPALTALPLAATGTLVFVPAMLAGMWLARQVPTKAITSGSLSAERA
ncbi:DUF6691 family protein [Faunimonas sp. B44]|uniref:DUF6691 family protein n=1 Tax=Faunimonas sp. B44 TaxID=3461493 RepID=UPI0040445B0C